MRKSYESQARQAEAFRLRDAGLKVTEIAISLGVTERSVWAWLAKRPPASPPVSRARALIAEALAVLGKVEA